MAKARLQLRPCQGRGGVDGIDTRVREDVKRVRAQWCAREGAGVLVGVQKGTTATGSTSGSDGHAARV